MVHCCDSLAFLLAIENLKMKNDLRKVEDVSCHSVPLLLHNLHFLYTRLTYYPFGLMLSLRKRSPMN